MFKVCFKIEGFLPVVEGNCSFMRQGLCFEV